MSFEFRRTLQKKKKKKLRRVYCKNKQTKKQKKEKPLVIDIRLQTNTLTVNLFYQSLTVNILSSHSIDSNKSK